MVKSEYVHSTKKNQLNIPFCVPFSFPRHILVYDDVLIPLPLTLWIILLSLVHLAEFWFKGKRKSSIFYMRRN